MLFLNRFCDDFRKFLRQVGVFEEGNENVLEATRAGERRTRRQHWRFVPRLKR